jgi:hypothetical protein
VEPSGTVDVGGFVRGASFSLDVALLGSAVDMLLQNWIVLLQLLSARLSVEEIFQLSNALAHSFSFSTFWVKQ